MNEFSEFPEGWFCVTPGKDLSPTSMAAYPTFKLGPNSCHKAAFR